MAAKVLTDVACAAAIAPARKRVELQDAKVPGLSLRVTDKGARTWIARYRSGAGQSRFTLGTFPAMGVQKARAAARKALLDVEEGRDPAAEKRREREEAKASPIKSFNDLADAYLKACETGRWKPKKKVKRARTLADETYILNRNIRPVLGKRAPKDITRRDVKALLGGMFDRGINAQTNKTQAVIRQVFNFAIEAEVPGVVVNPADKIQPLGIQKPRARIWSDGELKTLWTGLESPQVLVKLKIGRPVAIALQLAALLLQRESEVAGMALSELDLENATWSLPGERTKNGAEHLVPLPPRAVELIREAMALAKEGREEQPPYVFPSPRGGGSKPILGGALAHALRDLRTELKIVGPTVHDLRRTGSTALTSEQIGVSHFIRSKVLGHQSDAGGGAAVSSLHYDLNAYVAPKRAALLAWEALLLEIVGERPRPNNVRELKTA